MWTSVSCVALGCWRFTFEPLVEWQGHNEFTSALVASHDDTRSNHTETTRRGFPVFLRGTFSFCLQRLLEIIHVSEESDDIFPLIHIHLLHSKHPALTAPTSRVKFAGELRPGAPCLCE